MEDDTDLRRMFRHALTMAGFSVADVGNGLDALRQIDSQLPDAIVLDLGLPVVSGHAVLQEVAAHAHTRNIPVVVVTGQVSGIDPREVACMLRKPVSPDELVFVVRRCIAAGGGPAPA